MRSARLLETNKKYTEALKAKGIAKVNESIKAHYGLNIDKADFEGGEFSVKAFREGAYSLANRLKETNAEGLWNQLLRAGINNIAQNWYQILESEHEKVFQTVPSTHSVELYAPVHRAGTPRRVERGEQFPEVTIQGMDIQLKNYKFGAITVIEREMIDDDQTGQLKMRAMDMGEQMRTIEDVWAFTRLCNAASVVYGGDAIPLSETKPANEANWPYATSSAPLIGGGYNRPVTFLQVTEPNIQVAHIALRRMKDLNGNYLVVNPSVIVIAPENEFPVRTFLNSEWYPSTSAMATGGSGGATGLGTTFAKNVMQGIYDLVVSQFVPPKACWIGEAGKGWIFQQRDPLEVTAENPQSGPAFTQDEFRFKARGRWNPDVVDPRFGFLLNDGTV